MSLSFNPFNSDLTDHNASALTSANFGAVNSSSVGLAPKFNFDLPVIAAAKPAACSFEEGSLNPQSSQSLDESDRSFRDKILAVRSRSVIRVKKFKSAEKIKKIKKLSEKWRKECYKLKQNATKSKLSEVADQLDLASSVAGEIEDYDEEGIFFVAYAGSRPQGIAITDKNFKLVEWLVVSPSNIKGANQIDRFLPNRISGVGSKLIKAIVQENLAHKGGGSLEVHSADLSIGFYERLGFVSAQDAEMPNLMVLPSRSVSAENTNQASQWIAAESI